MALYFYYFRSATRIFEERKMFNSLQNFFWGAAEDGGGIILIDNNSKRM
jgi:hypothetical protein